MIERARLSHALEIDTGGGGERKPVVEAAK